jgi:cell pole-organizing protein PopZ
VGEFDFEFPDLRVLIKHTFWHRREGKWMLQEHTTIAGILAKMQQIVPDEPLPAEAQKTAPRPPELHIINSDMPVTDAAKPMPRIVPGPRVEETSGRPSPISSEPLDLVFSNAVREAVFPVAERWVNDHQAELISALGPILQRWMDANLQRHQAELISGLGPIFRRWMDEHLPKLVESILREEFRRRTHVAGRE